MTSVSRCMPLCQEGEREMIDVRENLCPRDHDCIPLEEPPRFSRPIRVYLLLGLAVWAMFPLGYFLAWAITNGIDEALAFMRTL
jgi:hypothetical protein